MMAIVILCLANQAQAQRRFVDRFGYTATLDELRVPSPSGPPAIIGGGGAGGDATCEAGWFILSFNDVISDTDYGYDDQVLGLARRTATCRAFTDLSALIEPANNPYTGQLNTEPYVYISVSGGSWAPDPNAIAWATPWYNEVGVTANSPIFDATTEAQRQGVLDGEVWRTLNGGIDSYLAYAFATGRTEALKHYHGRFGVNWNYPYHTDPGSLPTGNDRDLYTIILHEAMHLIDFHSMISLNGTSWWNTLGGWPGSDYYTRYDTYVNKNGIEHIINPHACLWENNYVSQQMASTQSCVIRFNSPLVANQGLYAPASWEQGSSMSHLHFNCGGPFLMDPGISPGTRFIPSQTESNILSEIGYHTSGEFGDANSGWLNGHATLDANGLRLAGVDDIFADYTTRDFHSVKQGTGPVLIQNHLENDEDESSGSGHPVDYECLTVLQGGGTATVVSATALSYEPGPDFTGWAILRYVPIGANGKRGSFGYIYVEVRPEDECASNACNILNGGDFEGIHLTTVGCGSYSNWLANEYFNTPSAMQYVTSDAQWISSTWGFSYDFPQGCPTTMPPTPASHSGVGAGNSSYVGVYNFYNGFVGGSGFSFELCQPLFPGHSYNLRFWAKDLGPCTHPWVFHALSDRPCNQAQGMTDLSGAVNSCNGTPYIAMPIATVDIPDGGWLQFNVPFTFTGSALGLWVVVTEGPTIGQGSLMLDDLEIVPTIALTAVVESCTPGGGSIDLSIAGGYAPYTISWSNGASDEDLAGLVAGEYAVIVTDAIGCTASSSWTVEPCCSANTQIPPNSLASVAGTYFTGSVNIQGLFTVDMDVTFDNAQVTLEAGAEIILEPGRNVFANSSTFEACNGIMWKGLTADDGCIVMMSDSRLADAEFGIRALNSAIIWVYGTEFHNNRAAITVPDQGQFNSVGVFVANSLFHAPGPLALPYPGQTSALGQRGFAGLDINRMSLDFTAGGNTFRNLSNGIVAKRCDVSVSGCYMEEIQPDPAYTLSGNGAGIYAYGRSGWYTLKQQGFGMQAAPSFSSCRWGIYTEYMNVRSWDNRMERMETSYHVERSGYRSVDILANDIRNHRNGIELLLNDGAAHVLVQGNEVHFGDFVACSPCPSFSGILVSEFNYANPSSVIRNNVLQYYLNGASRQGVNLITADDWLVADNELNMVHNIFSQTGVLQNGCRRTEISCNLIHCTDNNLINDRQAAIRSFNCTDALISCNDMDVTTNGMLFNGVGTGADVRGNSMRYHKFGLFLSSNAVVGAQDHRGNLWHLNPAPGGLGAKNLNPNAPGLPFIFNPQLISGGNTQPPSWSPSGWFDPGSEINYTCIDDIGDDYCGQFSERCLGCITELDERVAEGELENAPYTTETLYLLGAELYTKLDNHTDLLEAVEMADFYADKQSSNLPLLKAIENEKLALYDLAPAVVDQLHLNRELADAVTLLLHAALGELGEPSLTTSQRTTLLASIAAYRQNLAELVAHQTAILDLASTSKALSAENVRIANQGVLTSELIEANDKQVTDIYLAVVGADVDGFTAAQTGTLLDIANQCPLVGGNAVFRARALYTLIDAGAEYDDALLCLPHGILIKSKAEAATSSVRIIPNPAMATATLQLSAPLAAPATLVIRDALGTEVMRSRVPGQISTWQVGLEPLAPALYHYQLVSAEGVMGEGKLTIVR